MQAFITFKITKYDLKFQNMTYNLQHNVKKPSSCIYKKI
jgi:hypothetical protein